MDNEYFEHSDDESFIDDKLGNLQDKLSKMVQRMQHEQAKQTEWALAEGFLQWVVGPSGAMHLTHTTPEDLGVDPIAVFEGLEDVLQEIAAVYGF